MSDQELRDAERRWRASQTEEDATIYLGLLLRSKFDVLQLLGKVTRLEDIVLRLVNRWEGTIHRGRVIGGLPEGEVSSREILESLSRGALQRIGNPIGVARRPILGDERDGEGEEEEDDRVPYSVRFPPVCPVCGHGSPGDFHHGEECLAFTMYQGRTVRCRCNGTRMPTEEERNQLDPAPIPTPIGSRVCRLCNHPPSSHGWVKIGTRMHVQCRGPNPSNPSEVCGCNVISTRRVEVSPPTPLPECRNEFLPPDSFLPGQVLGVRCNLLQGHEGYHENGSVSWLNGRRA